MSQQGRWVYDPFAQKYVWVRTPAIVKAIRNQSQNLDQAINRMVAQGIALVAVAGVLWFVRELARAWDSA